VTSVARRVLWIAVIAILLLGGLYVWLVRSFYGELPLVGHQ